MADAARLGAILGSFRTPALLTFMLSRVTIECTNWHRLRNPLLKSSLFRPLKVRLELWIITVPSTSRGVRSYAPGVWPLALRRGLFVIPMPTGPSKGALERAVVFVDGNNCYHALRDAKFSGLSRLNYAKVSTKIVGARDWIGTRFYIGQVKNEGNKKLYDEQRRYHAFLKACDSRVSIHLGRLESHPEINQLSYRLKRYLADLKIRLDPAVYRDLHDLANAYERTKITAEKAVDVALAVDVVMMAQRDEYDTAYLLSADGDFTPAVKAARDLGKKVFAASPQSGAELAAVVHAFIPLPTAWFDDCLD